MYKHILIATDGSDLAKKAVEQGFSLAKVVGAKVTVVTVTEPWTAVAPGEMAIAFPIEEYEKSAEVNAARVLAAASDAAKASNMECATVHMKDQFPADGIIEASKANGCDLIVMASHGRRGLARLFLGSQAVRVLTHSPVPVLVCR
jgi:nucleotide-binding universal stress UspA family protein